MYVAICVRAAFGSVGVAISSPDAVVRENEIDAKTIATDAHRRDFANTLGLSKCNLLPAKTSPVCGKSAIIAGYNPPPFLKDLGQNHDCNLLKSPVFCKRKIMGGLLDP
jgi:hypothetical protein